MSAAQVAQVAVEGISIRSPGSAYVLQVAYEGIQSYQTVPLQVAQVAVECIVPNVVQPTQKYISAPPVSVTVAPRSSLPSKYRILVYDTSDNLVTIFTNVRAFDFIDTVNGGSAAGWFRISVDTPTLLAEDTGGSTKADQYRKSYLPSLNAVTITITLDSFGPLTGTYKVAFSGSNYGQQIVSITIDDYYQVSIPIYGNANTQASFTALVANAVAQYVSTIKGTPYAVSYTADDTYFLIAGPGIQQYTPPGGTSYYIGVQSSTSYMLPGYLAAAYQQAFQYNYRVQFYLEDSWPQYVDVDGMLKKITNGQPWYDGRINGWTPEIPDTSTDDAYITIYTEGYQNALDDGIVTETLNPGLQPNGVNNGTITADQYLRHLTDMYQNNRLFGKAYISSVNVDLYQLQFQGEGLANCINDVITQVISSTGHTWEWWVRGLFTVGIGKSLYVVVQPNADPKITQNPYMRIAPTPNPIFRYFVYEVRGQTIYDYQVQNTIINLYNMIALYGGRDPNTQLQVYGAFEDSISIALYGLRQQRVTNDNLLTSQTLNNYAIAYLLLNAYPQPQTTYYKYTPTDQMRAGVWVQVLEMGDGTVIGQTLHQMRSIQVECQLQEDQEKMDQIVTAAAPVPFIDHAYYGALQKSRNTIPVVIDRGGTVNPNTYIVGGGDWVDAGLGHPIPVFITPPLGNFGKAKENQYGNKPSNLPVKLSMDPNSTKDGVQCVEVALQDTVSGKNGDGAYELDFVTNMQEFAPEQPVGQGILVTCVGGPSSVGGLNNSNVQEVPQSPDLLRLWTFVVLDGSIAGAVDMRTYYGQYTDAPDEAQSIMLTVPAATTGDAPHNNHHVMYEPPSKGAVDWYGNDQIGTSGAQIVLWFCQAGAPHLNTDPPSSFVPVPYKGNMAWFDTISGLVNQIPWPDWAKELYHSENLWGPEASNTTMRDNPRPIGFVTQPYWEKLAAVKAGPLGSGSGPLGHNGGIFYNPDFPGGVGARMTLYMPQIELPMQKDTYLFYELTIIVTCTGGNTFQTKRQFVVRNVGGNNIGG